MLVGLTAFGVECNSIHRFDSAPFCAMQVCTRAAQGRGKSLSRFFSRPALPVVDAFSIKGRDSGFTETAKEIGSALREYGFVYLKHTRLHEESVRNAIEKVTASVFQEPNKNTFKTTDKNPYGYYMYQGTPDRFVSRSANNNASYVSDEAVRPEAYLLCNPRNSLVDLKRDYFISPYGTLPAFSI
jgi:hypothetical protein